MKREPTLLLAIAGISLAFATVSLLVWLSRGNSKLVARKLRLGALLIGLTATTTACPISSCYEEPISDDLFLNDQSGAPLAYGDTIRVFNGGEVVLSGRVDYRAAESFSFRVARPSGSVVLSGPIEATDGAFDEETEELTLRFDASKLEPGEYKLEVTVGDRYPYDSNRYTLLVYPPVQPLP